MIRRAVAVLALSVMLAAPSLAGGAQPGSTWPCVQRKVAELSLASIWQRGELPDSARQLAKDPAVQALAETLAARRTPMEEAEGDIKAFAKQAGANRDGMLQGLNLDATIALADAVTIPVIASGGLASLDDVKKMLEPRARKLEGAIAGRALYDGRLDAQAALDLIRAAKAG